MDSQVECTYKNMKQQVGLLRKHYLTVFMFFPQREPQCDVVKAMMKEKSTFFSLGYHSLEGHFGYVVDITWLSTGWRLASASHDGSVKIWDTKKGLCYDTKSLKFALILGSKIIRILVLTAC